MKQYKNYIFDFYGTLVDIVTDENKLELWEKPLFPHALNMYHAYWDTLIRQAQPSPGVQKFMQELKKRGIRIGIGTDMTAYVQYKKLSALGLYSYIDFISNIKHIRGLANIKWS